MAGHQVHIGRKVHYGRTVHIGRKLHYGRTVMQRTRGGQWQKGEAKLGCSPYDFKQYVIVTFSY
jgi:hypothetical protein